MQGGLVGTGSEFPKSLSLKTGQGVSYSVVCPGNVKSPNLEIMLHGNKYQETHHVHDPRSSGMTRVNDSNNTLVITPESKTFAGKVGYHSAQARKTWKKYRPFH